MLILYTAMKYDYGKADQGFSFEHHNFYDSLLHMGHEVLYFDFLTLLHERGRRRMNRRLLEVAKAEKPVLLFTVLFGDQLDQNVIRQISRSGATVTLNWFCDDHWRFENFSRHWAPCFNWVVTTSAAAVARYAAIGYTSVIKSQWGCNHFLYGKRDLPLAYDVTFVGQPHGDRREVIERLRKAGLSVKVWGSGWESGRLTQEDMIRVFSQSRINLNLSNAAQPALSRVRTMLTRVAALSTLAGPFHPLVRRRLTRRAQSAAEPKIAPTPRYAEQIKGRNFEIPGCGGFVLTGHAENLDAYYTPGKEVACFRDTEELLHLTRHYLAHEDERTAIALAGYERTLGEHTYAHRFREIFQIMGLPGDVGASVGQTREIA